MTLRTLFATICLLIMAACVSLAQDAIDWIDLGNGVEAQAYFSPYESMDEKLMAAMDLAAEGSTIYMSYYSMSNWAYAKKAQALAKSKNVKVKLNLWDTSVEGYSPPSTEDKLRSYQDKGAIQIFPTTDDPTSGVIPNLRKPRSTSGHNYYPASMHTKFTIVTPAVGERIVITGSANLSNSAAIANYEHLIMIRSNAIAEEFEKEWNEQRQAGAIMREAVNAADDEWPLTLPSDWTRLDPDFKAMQSSLRSLDQRTDNGHPTLQTYFSPDDGIASQLSTQLKRAKSSIKVAIYVIAHEEIAEILQEKAAEGVQVTILANSGGEGMEGRASKRFFYGEPGGYEGFLADPNVHCVGIDNHRNGDRAKNHHKYAIVDDQVVIGGSFNWSYIATYYSDENIVVVDNKEFAARFVKDFAMILEEHEPVATLFEGLDEDKSGVLEASEREAHPHAGWAPDVDQSSDLSLEELRSYRMPFEATAETRVLFVAQFPKNGSAFMPRGYDFMVVGDHPALKGGIVLKNSASTGENCFGSVMLPAGEEFEYRLVLRKGKKAVSISDLLTSGGNAATDTGVHHDGEPRTLSTNPHGLPMMVRSRWTGPSPLN